MTRREGGFGIIEVLVALVVVSLGVLGVAGLQLTGMQHGSSGFNRTKALLFAEDLAARVRLNSAGMAGEVDGGLAIAGDGYCAARPTPWCEAGTAGAARDCGPAELARFDLHAVACGPWNGGAAVGGVIGDALPSGSIALGCDPSPCVPSSTWDITVAWVEGSTTSRIAGDRTVRRVNMRLRP